MGRLGLILLLVSCGHYQRHVQQHQQSTETTNDRWAKTASSTATSSATNEKREDARKVRRRVRTEKRPDGTTVVTDTTTIVDKGVVASSSSTATAVAQRNEVGQVVRVAAQRSDSRSDTGVKTGWSRWWLLLLPLVPAAAFARWRLEPLRRLWHLVKR